MRILITGGSGLIGRPLIANLARNGNEVIVLSRRPERIIGLPKGVLAKWWDSHTTEGWRSLVDGVDAIVNLAGENISSGRWTDERKRGILGSRVNVGRALVQAVEAATHKPRVVIQASGVGYYGPSGDGEITEETPPGYDFLSTGRRRVGGLYSPLGNGRRTAGSHPPRGGAQHRRRCLASDVATISSLRWRAFGEWTAVVSLDPHCRRSGRHPFPDRKRDCQRSVQSDCASSTI